VSIGSAADSQPPHKGPYVQPYVEVWPSCKPGLQLGQPFIHTAATVHVKHHWGRDSGLVGLGAPGRPLEGDWAAPQSAHSPASCANRFSHSSPWFSFSCLASRAGLLPRVRSRSSRMTRTSQADLKRTFHLMYLAFSIQGQCIINI